MLPHLFKPGVAAAAVLCAGLFTAGHAAAFVLGPPITTFEFTGSCTDCTLTNDPLIGTLMLEGYTPGDAIDETNFVAFQYGGSDLVDPYSVTRAASTPLPHPGRSFVFISGADHVSGAMPSGGGPGAFVLRFDDGLAFVSAPDGRWFTCAPGGGVYYGGSCNLLNNADFGTGTWAAAPIPEPSTYGMLALGLAALAGLAARRQKRQA